MATTEVGLKLTADSSQAAASINQLQSNLKAAKKDLNDAKIGSDEYTEAQKRVKEATDQLTKAQGGSADAFGVLKEKIMGTVPGLQAAESGVTSFGASLKALMANPIVLLIAGIVAALGLLYEAFTYSVAGAKKMEQVFAGLKAGLDVIVDRLMSAGQAVIKFFSGDWSGAAKDMKAAFTGIGDAVGKAYDEVSKATEELQKLHKAEREASVARAQQNAAIVKSKELLNDENASIRDRQKALKEVGDFEKKIGEEDVARAKEKLKLQTTIWGQTKEGLKKHAQELAELQIDIANKEEETARKTIQIQRQGRTLNKQMNAEAKAEAEEAKKAEKERLDNIRDYQYKIDKLKEEEHLATIDDTYKKEKAQLEIKLQDDLRAAKLDLEQKKITKQQYADLEVEYRKLTAIKIADIDKKQAADEQKKSEEYAKKVREFEDKLAADLEKIRLKQVAQRNKDRQEQIKLIESELNLERTKHQLTFQMEIDAYNRKRDLERQILVDQEADAAQLQAFDQETANGRMALDEKEKEAKIANLTTVGQALQGLGQLVGQNTAAGKALSIAEATINTYTGATKALAQGGIYGAIAAAGVIAAGLASVEKIVSTPVPGASGGSAGSAPSMSIPSPLKPRGIESPSAVISADSLNQINASATRAYVVESDVTNNQQRISRINRAARIA
jgi:hypothetical protein